MEVDKKTDRHNIKREIRAGQKHFEGIISTSLEKMEAAI
jgi:hypothetical protein